MRVSASIRRAVLIVSDGEREIVYVTVMQLARGRFGTDVTATERTGRIDVDDVGGI